VRRLADFVRCPGDYRKIRLLGVAES